MSFNLKSLCNKKSNYLIWVFSFCFFIFSSCLMAMTNNPDSVNSYKLILTTDSVIKANNLMHITAKIIDINTQKLLTLDDLKEVHTKKIHLLVIDPSLTDYHHIHPIANQEKNIFSFDFKPKLSSSYRFWADITLLNNKHYYIYSDLASVEKKATVAINKNKIMTSTADGLTFKLTLAGKPRVGQAVMAMVHITKDGKPFSQLEPVMGAFGHVVGFNQNYQTIMHIHPMGEEPSKLTDRGGPDLELHLEPEIAGFYKLFVQVRVNQQDVFAPLAFVVKK